MSLVLFKIIAKSTVTYRIDEAWEARDAEREEATDARDSDSEAAAELIEERALEASPAGSVPVAVGAGASVLVRVARAEVSIGRAPPVVPADARASRVNSERVVSTKEDVNLPPQ